MTRRTASGLFIILVLAFGLGCKIEGPVAIAFTRIPSIGSFANLAGEVTGVETNEYRVAVYIYVNGWWTKPTFASPLTPIGWCGGWTCDITTGGHDEHATMIAAFLIPAGVEPPACGGCGELPAIPEAVAFTCFDRDS